MTLGRVRRNVLDEEKYLDDLEHIIKRDFFPDSEIIELQLRYYDAVDAQNFDAMKEIQMKISRINDVFDESRSLIGTPKHFKLDNAVPYKNPSIRDERDLSLNEYLSRNTSEDNDSFTELQRKTIDRQLKKLSWSFNAAREFNNSRLQALSTSSDVKAITCGHDSTADNQKSLERSVFNPVFFNPDCAALSITERMTLAGKKSEIVYENTRFRQPLSFERRRPKTSKNKSVVPGKVGHDGKEIDGLSTPRVGGYSILGRTPTPSPSTPDMTWGGIDCTPTEIIDTPTSRFRIQELSEREKLAHEMASKSSKKREKKLDALQKVKSTILRPGSSARTIVTPAAMKLLSRMTPSIRSIKSSRFGETPNITDNLLDL